MLGTFNFGKLLRTELHVSSHHDKTWFVPLNIEGNK